MTTKGYSIDLKKKKCVSPVCRGGYVNILEARPLPQSDKMAWGMQCMFPKSDVVKAWVEELKQVYAQVLTDKFGQQEAQKIAKVLLAKKSFPVRDGDDPGDAGALSNAEQLQGHYFVNANNKFRQPHIIGAMGKPVDPAILTLDDVYSGAWYRVMLEFWYYDTAGNKGISTSLTAVMKVKDGDNLGGGTTATEASNAFNDFADEAADIFGASAEEKEENKEKEEEKEVGVFNFM